MKDINFYLEQRYPIALYPAKEGGYVAEIQELKGCMTQGETIEEEIAEIENAKRLWIESEIEHGDPIPLPSASEEKSTLKRYLLFAGFESEACGGWNDFVNSFDTIADAEIEGKKILEGQPQRWYHVVDVHKTEIVDYPEDQIVAQGES